MSAENEQALAALTRSLLEKNCASLDTVLFPDPDPRFVRAHAGIDHVSPLSTHLQRFNVERAPDGSKVDTKYGSSSKYAGDVETHNRIWKDFCKGLCDQFGVPLPKADTTKTKGIGGRMMSMIGMGGGSAKEMPPEIAKLLSRDMRPVQWQKLLSTVHLPFHRLVQYYHVPLEKVKEIGFPTFQSLIGSVLFELSASDIDRCVATLSVYYPAFSPGDLANITRQAHVAHYMGRVIELATMADWARVYSVTPTTLKQTGTMTHPLALAFSGVTADRLKAMGFTYEFMVEHMGFTMHDMAYWSPHSARVQIRKDKPFTLQDWVDLGFDREQFEVGTAHMAQTKMLALLQALGWSPSELAQYLGYAGGTNEVLGVIRANGY